MQFTGWETATHTAPTRARSGNAGANNTSAPRLLEGLQAPDRVVEIGTAAHEVFRADRESEGQWQGPRRLRCGADACIGVIEIVKRLAQVARRILNGATHQSCLGGEPDGFSPRAGTIAKAALQIRRDWQVRGRHDEPRVSQRLVPCHPTIAPPQGSSTRAARSGQRWKSQPRQHSRRAAVPGVGDEESILRLVQRTKGTGFIQGVIMSLVSGANHRTGCFHAQEAERQGGLK